MYWVRQCYIFISEFPRLDLYNLCLHYHRDVMHSSLPAAEKEQVFDGLILGYQLMRLAMG
jgi:hypothetical protein